MPNFNQNLKNELAKKCGLVLLGSHYSSLDFSFERPFCLYNSVGLADFRGGLTHISMLARPFAMLVWGGIVVSAQM